MNESGLLPSVSIAPVAEGERLQISSIGVATRNRFSELKRCLGSYICNLRRHGRGFDLVVVDDSDKSEDRNACRAWLRCLSHKLNLKIFYAGFEEKLSYVDRIASMGLRADLVRFVLTNPLNISSSPGANRNAILLHSVGELVLACDDDSVCFLADLRNGPQSPRLVRFGNVSLDTHFVANRRSAVDSVHRATCDVFAAHEELLGKCIIDRLPPGSGGIQESSIWREDNSSTSVLGKRKVTRITASGVLGNSGMPNCIGFMLAKGEVRERFLHQWSLDDSPYSSQYVIRGVCRPIVARSAGVMMTTATGLDNRVPLPPFISSGRGEDTLFGVTASQCFPDMYIGFVPFALLHAPARARPYGLLDAVFRIADVIMMILEQYRTTAGTYTVEGLRSVGRHFADFGNAEPKEFQERLTNLARSRVHARMEMCEQRLLQYHRAPKNWALELERWVVQLRSFMQSTDVAVPAELRSSASYEECCRMMQQFVVTYGEVLQEWPDIVTAAKRLRNDGCRLANSTG